MKPLFAARGGAFREVISGFYWFFCGLFVATVALIATIWSIAPRQDGLLLVPATGWSQTTFLNNGSSTSLPAIYARSPEVRIWRNWPPQSPELPYVRGEVWTESMMPPSFIGIPIGGNSQYQSGNRVVMECTTDHRQRPLAELELFNETSLVLVDTRGFCAGPVRVGAISAGRQLLTLGTPIELPRAQAITLRFFVPLLGGLLAATVIGLIWVAASFAASAAGIEDLCSLAIFGLLATGVIAMATFWTFSFSPVSGIGALCAVAATALAAILHAMRCRHAFAIQSLATPFGAWLIFGLLVLSLGQAIDNGGGPTAANAVFAPAIWSTDNQIPTTIARGFARGLPFNELNLGRWLVSDRPPLASGYLLLIENLLTISLPETVRFSTPVAAQAAGVMVMSLWVPATWLGLRLLGLREDFILLLICLAGFTGFSILNSLYIWPKMLAGGFGLLMILSLAALRERSQSPTILLFMAAISAALAFLSHGSAIFGIVAALIVFAPAILHQGVRAILISGATGAALLASWFVWQTTFQPGGNVLARFALVGGSLGFDRRNISVLSDVIDAYGKLTLLSYLQMKGHALLELIGAVPHGCGPPRLTFTEGGIGALRFHEFFYLGYVVAPAALSAIACTLFRSDGAVRGPVRIPALLTVSTVTFVLWFVVSWGCHIVITFAYQAVLATFVGCWAISFIANRNLATLFATASVVLTLAVWIVHPLTQALAVSWPWFLVFTALLAVGTLAASAILDPRTAGST